LQMLTSKNDRHESQLDAEEIWYKGTIKN